MFTTSIFRMANARRLESRARPLQLLLQIVVGIRFAALTAAFAARRIENGVLLLRIRGGRGITVVGCLGGIALFLWAVAVRVGIVAIRIVVVGGAGIDGVQDYTEKVTLHADQEIAGAGESFLR